MTLTLLFWLSFDCFWRLVRRWYIVGTVPVDLWRLVHQWFWVFLTIVTVYESSKTVKRQSNSKKMTIGVQIVICLNRVRRIHKAAQTPLPREPPSHVPGQWPHPVAHGQGWLYVSTWTSMRLAPVSCRVLLHSLLPTDDACSSSSLSKTVIKFSIFSDLTRKLSALPPELRRIR